MLHVHSLNLEMDRHVCARERERVRLRLTRLSIARRLPTARVLHGPAPLVCHGGATRQGLYGLGGKPGCARGAAAVCTALHLARP
jgi:hypothetical protein